MKRRSIHGVEAASSLITALLVIVVLSTIVVSFMHSMSVERMTAKSMANQYRATLVSDAAVQAALHDLTRTTNSGPYATVFQLEPGTQAPYLFQAKYLESGPGVGLARQPQFSTVQHTNAYTNSAVPLVPKDPYEISDFWNGSAVSRSLTRTSELFVDINIATKAFPYGQVGLTAANAALPIPVSWIYIRDEDGTVVGRYAYWVDDESSKIDLRFAGNQLGTAGGHLRGNGTNGNEVSLHILTNTGFTPVLLTNLFAYKSASANRFSVTDARYGAAAISDAQWALIRPHVTAYSLHDDRAPDGKRKLNLNQIVTASRDPKVITAEMHAIRDAILENLPRFGTRYYKQYAAVDTSVTAFHQRTYVAKIAANIRDFMDEDRNATVVLSDGNATVSNLPDFVGYDDLDAESIPCFGKENVPLLNEYVRVMRVVRPVPDLTAPNAALRNVTLRASHYVEVWNLTGTAIGASQLGSNPFIGIARRTSWHNFNLSGGLPSILRPIDIRIYLPTAFTVPAGGYAVISTNDERNDIGPAANHYVVSRLPGDTEGLDAPRPGTWQVVDGGGQTVPTGDFEDYVVSTARDSVGYYVRAFDTMAGTYSDCRERMILANDHGLLDYTPAIYTVQNSRVSHKPEQNPGYLCTFIADNETYSFNTSGRSETLPRYTRGDPRSNTESIAMGIGTSGSWKDGETGVANLGNTQATLGRQNLRLLLQPTGVSLWRKGWNEYTTDAAGNHHVADAKLSSLGQLGYVYDPARYDAAGYRGAGRTLRIGQSDDPSNHRNGDSTAEGYENWLGGVGSTNVASTNSRINASRLLEVFRTDETHAGRINPNGILRGSNNPVMMSVLEGFTFSANPSEASSALSGRAVDGTQVMAAMTAALTNGCPFVGVGSLGDLPLFHSGTTLAGVAMPNVSDAGKEEFFRRTANLLTTESLAFTIISKAQSGRFRRDSVGIDCFIPSATVTRESTVQLVPRYPPGEVRPIPVSWEVRVVRDIHY